jgi:hypothetical protein
LLLLQIIPADLNAFLYQMETNIAWAAGQLGDGADRTKFEQLANTRRNSINQVLWDNASGLWVCGVSTLLNACRHFCVGYAVNEHLAGLLQIVGHQLLLLCCCLCLSPRKTIPNSSADQLAHELRCCFCLFGCARAGMWRDGILAQSNNASGAGGSNSSSSSSSSSGTVYTLTLNPGVFASNFIPLWAGVADGGSVQGGRVVEALNASGLVQPSGKEGGGDCY